MVKVLPSNAGTLQLANCSFWGPHNKVIEAEGSGVVSLSQCNFVHWGRDPGMVAVDMLGGSLIMQGCIFGQAKPHIRLAEAVASAVIMGNSFRGGPQISSEAGGQVEMLGNVTLP